ncbi:hypothetical protein [Micromonospora aurantiaca (nom. illeg.)]|uniref:hypothetical protein n=1 Tax=Micromonospora aurantiaca (nom. illeg.) TaxID=47850 RepID=UPI000B86898D|nr:hypothetical protein [Micromonospora aurantiaca]
MSLPQACIAGSAPIDRPGGSGQQIKPTANLACAAVAEQQTERLRTALVIAGRHAKAAELAGIAAVSEIGEFLRQDQARVVASCGH